MFILIAVLAGALDISHAASLREQQFNLTINRSSLTSVLDQLSTQTGLHIGIEANAASRRAKRYGPFVGKATADEAIKALLKNSDLWYAWREENTIRLFLISAQSTNWSSGASTAREASTSIRGLAGVNYKAGSCGERPVGPFESHEPITAETFWVELIKPHCEVLRQPSTDIEPGSIDRLTVAGQAEHDFSIEALPRLLTFQRISSQAGVVVDYVSTDAQEERALLAPISGSMSLNQALQNATRDSPLRIRWSSDNRVSVEPAYVMVAYADMSKCACNFGLPEIRPVRGDHVTVERSRLTSLQQASQVPVVVFDRRFIDATGASSIPELLNTLAQQAFSRSRGFQSSAAQYFEGRGFGAAYSLILINGHRAYGSATDPMTNAFDLNVVPLSAVESIEITLDHPSVSYGMDAFGGTVNIVLRKDLEKNAAVLSLGSAAGGAEKNIATLLADFQGTKWNAGFVLDHLTRGELLGATRSRWRNQNYTKRQHDAADYRLPGVLPNVYSDIDGIATLLGGYTRDAHGLTFRSGVTNLDSALAYAGIEPRQERSNLYGFSNIDLGNAEINLGLLYGQQTVGLRALPVSVPRLTWGEYHPQNPFGRDVLIDAMLVGLPPRMHETESVLTRVMADLTQSFDRWRYSTFVVAQRDRSRTWLANDVNLTVLADLLKSPTSTFNVLSDRPGSGAVPPGLLSPSIKHPSETEAVQMGFTVSGKPIDLPAGDVELDLGTEYRKEAARFDPRAPRFDREVKSTFADVRVPLIGERGTRHPPGLELGAGIRRDFHSDVRYVTTWQSALTWRPVSALQIHAGYSTLFRPPSLYELYLPRFSFPTEIFDSQRGEPASIMLVTGGNPSLDPTEGQSMDLGVTYATDAYEASLKYWETRMRNRVSPVLVPDLVNAHDDVAGRIERGNPNDGMPLGRILSLDTRFANFGSVSARGFDLSLKRTIRTSIGWVTPRIDITRTVDFQYRDLPAASAPLLDRAGIASIYGTIPSGRAVASLLFETEGLQIATFVRYHSPYDDYSIVAGAVTGRRVLAQTLLDIKVTKDFGKHLTLSIGANNALDDQPPFAQAGGWEGFDQSQGNLLGREAFLEVTGSF